jgi:hypothetical protein
LNQIVALGKAENSVDVVEPGREPVLVAPPFLELVDPLDPLISRHAVEVLTGAGHRLHTPVDDAIAAAVVLCRVPG